MKLNEALTILNKKGYIVESKGSELLQGFLQKFNHWNEIRNTPEGDDLWDEICEEYDDDFREIATECYDPNENVIDVSAYLSSADRIYPEMTETLKKMGFKEFKFNVRTAFKNRADYLYDAMFDNPSIKFRPDLTNFNEPYMVAFEITK
jgi:hypothetical protein